MRFLSSCACSDASVSLSAGGELVLAGLVKCCGHLDIGE
jgi:hypothetical protein